MLTHRTAGKGVSPNRLIYCAVLVLSGVVASSAAGQESPPLAGYWTGHATHGDERTRFGVRVWAEAGAWHATIDLPDLGALGWPAESVEVIGPTVRVVFPSDSGPNVLEGQVTNDRLEGGWSMPGQPGEAEVVLARAALPGRVTTEDVTIERAGVQLGGTIVLPAGRGPWPAVVFVHGSGPATRDASRFFATEFAGRGIASLIFDKRGTGASSGDWREAGFYTLARDVLAAVEVLKAHPAIDENAIGLCGQSQGGWVGPLAAVQSDDVALVVMVSGPAVSPAEEGHWNVIYRLRQAGFGDAAVGQAVDLLRARDDLVRFGAQAQEPYDSALASASEEAWFAESGFVGLDASEPWQVGWYRRVLDYEPVPVLRELSVPLLALFGEEDASVPVQRSADVLRRFQEDSDAAITVAIYPGADHALRRTSAGGRPLVWPGFVEGYIERQTTWILEQSAELR